MLNRYDRKGTFDWQHEFQERHTLGMTVKRMVGRMSPTHYLSDELSQEDFEEYVDLANMQDQAPEFLIDELLSIVDDGEPSENLTEKYYAMKVLSHMQHVMLRKKVQDFVALPPEKQTLEMGAILVAQWMQPTENVTANEVLDKIDNIAFDVRAQLRETNPQHPVLTAEFDHEDIQENKWSCDQCRAILDAINHVLYKKLAYQGNKKNYYKLENSYLNKVLKLRTGIPITLSVLYTAVARRLGIICEPVNAPTHFLLRWKQRPLGTNDSMYTYIDAFNAGKFLQQDDVPQALGIPQNALNMSNMHSVITCEVIQRMIRNLIAIGREQGQREDNLVCLRNALELSLLLKPDDVENRLLLVRVNVHLNINLPDVVDSLEIIAGEDQSRMGLVANLMVAAQHQIEENKKNKEKRKIKVKTRKKAKDALYSVGLVMRHRRYNYNCVIYGWDSKCMASQEWIIQMGVNNLPHKDNQPFYNVLVEDGSNRYAAEESLECHESPCPIDHEKVGKYFSTFDGTYYTMNTEKASEYPGDADLTGELVHQNYHI